jgi:hypothetical protein
MATSFTNCSISQLKKHAQRNFKRLDAINKNPVRARGLSVAQRKAAINREQNKITTALRRQVLKIFDTRIKNCVPKSKKLKQFRSDKRKFSNCKKLETLLKLLVGFKAPSTTARKATKKTTSKKNSQRKTSLQVQTLQRENLVLRKHNQFMQAQVAKFKKQVQMMGRDYGRYNNKVAGNFNTQCATSQQIQKLVQAAQTVAKSNNISPQQKLQRITTKINKIHSILTPVARRNNIVKWPVASKKQVERDITNILRISTHLLRAQARK